MRHRPVLLTLGWRWRTIAVLPQWLFVALLLNFVFRALDDVLQSVGLRATGASLASHHDADGVAGMWLAGLALGFVIAWPVHELLRCPITATTPRLRRSLAVEVPVAFAAAAALFWLAASGRRSALELATVAAIGFFGAGLGVLVANPHRYRAWSTAIGLFLGLFVVGELLQTSWPWPREHASLAIPSLVALGLAAVFRAYSAAEHRTYLADPSPTDGPEALTLDMAHRDPDDTAIWAPTWRGGRNWARATLHELHGARPLGWALETAKYLTLFALLVAIPWDPDVFDMRPRPSVWFLLASNALGENSTFWRILLTFWLLAAASWATSVPCVPRIGVVRPASRSERARSAWLVFALRFGISLAASALIATGLAAIGAWRSAAAGDPPLALHGAPDLLGAIAIVAIVAPWAAWLRLRLLDLWFASRRFPNPLRQGAVATLAVVGSLIVGHVLGSAWTAAEELHPALAPVLFGLAIVASWLGYRTALDRLFRTVALPV